MLSILKNYLKYTVLIGVIIVPFFFFGVNKNVTFETIKWDGETISFDDFKPLTVDWNTGDTIFEASAEELKWPGNLTYVNDSVVLFIARFDFHRLKTINLNTGDLREYLPLVSEEKTSTLSNVRRAKLTPEEIWLSDEAENKILVLENNYDESFPFKESFIITTDFNRAVPSKSGEIVFLPAFDKNVRVASFFPDKDINILSRKFPPIKRSGDFTNMEVQADMDVSPDMDYLVVATLGWDFIEVYKDGDVRMMQGPLFKQTAIVEFPGLQDPWITFKNQKITFMNLKVRNSLFFLGIARDISGPDERRTIYDVQNILVFSKNGDPLYLIEVPIPVSEFDIDFEKGEMIVLQDFDNPRILRFKIDFPEVG